MERVGRLPGIHLDVISIHRARKCVIVCGRLSGEVIEYCPEELRGKTKVIMQQYLARKEKLRHIKN